MLELKEITKTYNTGKIEVQAIKGISLKAEDGEFIAVIGPSGSGKSTFMNIIGCLDVPTTGEYYIEDTEVSNYNENQLAEIRNKKIGFIFQKFNLLPKLNAFENVELPLIYRGLDSKNRKERALNALESVGLNNRLTHIPSELSGGQQQRVAIARALAGDPPIVLADEPTGNLDSKSGIEVLKILQDLNANGRTIILITHDMDVAKNANRIISIKDGLISDERMK
ncbi:ABC transporter ATP-binding protein [Brassicibacter mesophilus]|uniref:ABC transporter ATP-binding protein n=1 Tax=Brassicibacter mesophilus TaxID=745119 RepID=UPI003D25B494